jgi:preprotein translocase subunit YajC
MFDSVIERVVFAQTGTGQPWWATFVPFAMVLVIVYFLILLPTRRQRQKVQAFQDALKVGDKVVTTSGIYGLITRVNDKSVQVQIADKVKIEMSRQAIGGYQGQDPVVQESANA